MDRVDRPADLLAFRHGPGGPAAGPHGPRRGSWHEQPDLLAEVRSRSCPCTPHPPPGLHGSFSVATSGQSWALMFMAAMRNAARAFLERRQYVPIGRGSHPRTACTAECAATAVGHSSRSLLRQARDGQRMPVAVLVGMLEVGVVQHLADDILGPVAITGVEQCVPGRQAVEPELLQAVAADQLLPVQPLGVRRVAVVEPRQVQLAAGSRGRPPARRRRSPPPAP